MNIEHIIPAGTEEADYISYNTHKLSYTIAFILSGLGIFYIMLTLFLLRLFKNPLSRMAFFISLCDLVINITMVRLYYFDSSEIHEATCKFYVGIAHYTVLSSFCWATCFTHAFYKVIQEETDQIINSKMKYYFGISVILPIPLAILADELQFVEYSPQQDRLCYHKLVRNAIDKSFFYTENIPFAVALFLSFYYCIRSIRLMNRIETNQNRLRFLYIMQFPIILLICWFGQQLNVIFAQLGISLPMGKEIGTVFQTLIYLQGFINAIVYGISYRVLTGYKDLYKKYCRRKSVPFNSSTKKFSMDEVAISSQENSDTEVLEAELFERAMRKKTLGSKGSGAESLSSILMKNSLVT